MAAEREELERLKAEAGDDCCAVVSVKTNALEEA